MRHPFLRVFLNCRLVVRLGLESLAADLEVGLIPVLNSFSRYCLADLGDGDLGTLALANIEDNSCSK